MSPQLKNKIEDIVNVFESGSTNGNYATLVKYKDYSDPVRGSRQTLSNHAFGSAFDINAAWNGLGVIPPLVGQKGSVRELVALANENGFYWGGHFPRRDGMHFEIAKIL